MKMFKELCVKEERCWSLVYKLLIEFNVGAIFKVYRPNVPEGSPGKVIFALDRRAPNYEQAKAFVEAQADNFESPAVGNLPGTTMEIHDFDGVFEYMTLEEEANFYKDQGVDDFIEDLLGENTKPPVIH